MVISGKYAHKASVGGGMDFDSTLKEIEWRDDYLVSDVENLVKAKKEAVEVTPKRRKHSVPNEFVLRVKVVSGLHSNLLVLAKKAGGQKFISLVTERGEKIREYHYQHAGHPNPDNSITGKSHKHLPTEKYPILKNHKKDKTWAYDPEEYPEDFEGAVIDFCEENNIDLVALQKRLKEGWFK